MKRLYIIYIIAALFAASCGDSKPTAQQHPMPVERIDLYISGNSTDISPDSLQPGLDLYIGMMGLDTSQRDSSIAILKTHAVTQVFGHDIAERFSQADSLAPVLGNMTGRLKKIAPAAVVSHIYGIASPYRQSVVVSDSTILLAINHYLGPDYPGYASMPAYATRLKTASRIPCDIAEAAIRVNYPFKPAEGNMLERMLYEGAVIAAMTDACDTDLMTALGYDREQYNLLEQTEAALWSYYADNNLLYTTSPTDIGRFFDPAPHCIAGNMQLPGQAGRFTAAKIIESYKLSNPEMSVEQMLSPDFYNQSFQQLLKSGYTPQ